MCVTQYSYMQTFCDQVPYIQSMKPGTKRFSQWVISLVCIIKTFRLSPQHVDNVHIANHCRELITTKICRLHHYLQQNCCNFYTISALGGTAMVFSISDKPPTLVIMTLLVWIQQGNIYTYQLKTMQPFTKILKS